MLTPPIIVNERYKYIPAINKYSYPIDKEEFKSTNVKMLLTF